MANKKLFKLGPEGLNPYNYYTLDENNRISPSNNIIFFKCKRNKNTGKYTVSKNSTKDPIINKLIESNFNNIGAYPIKSSNFSEYLKKEISIFTNYDVKDVSFTDTKITINYSAPGFHVLITKAFNFYNYLMNKDLGSKTMISNLIEEEEQFQIYKYFKNKSSSAATSIYLSKILKLDENKNWSFVDNFTLKKKLLYSQVFYQIKNLNLPIEEKNDTVFNSDYKSYVVKDEASKNLDEIFEEKEPYTIKFSGPLLKQYNEEIKAITLINTNNKYFKPVDKVSFKSISNKENTIDIKADYFSLKFNTKTKEFTFTKKKKLIDLNSFVANNNIEEKLEYLNSKNLRIIGKEIFENPDYNKDIVITIENSKFFGFAFPNINLPLAEWKEKLDYVLEHPNEERDKYEFNYINSLLNSHYSNYKHKLLLLDLLKLIQSNSSNISKTGILNLIRGSKSSTYNYLKKPNNTYKNYPADFIENLILELERKKIIDFYEAKNTYKVIYNIYKFNERLKIEDFDCFKNSEEFKVNQNILELINKKDLTIQDYLFVINNLKYSGIIARNFNSILDIFKNKPEQIETILKMKIKTESNKDIKTLLNKLLKSKN